MKAPVGLLSDRTVLRQRDGENLAPFRSPKCQTIAPCASEKLRTRTAKSTCTVTSTAYGPKIQACLRFESWIRRLVRSSRPYRLPETSPRKMHFLRTVEQAVRCPANRRTLRPPGKSMLCVAPEYPRVGTLVFYFLPEYGKFLQGKAKSGRTCNGKRKMPSLVAGAATTQGREGNNILNKTAE